MQQLSHSNTSKRASKNPTIPQSRCTTTSNPDSTNYSIYADDIHAQTRLDSPN